MDRLTDKNGWNTRLDSGQINAIYNRLAAYEDTGLTPEQVAAYAKSEAEGRLIVLPVKVGDEVWDTESLTESPARHFVLGVDILRSLNMMHLSGGQSLPVTELGKTVFTSREAAEAALKEAQQG